jgi:Fic family protein
MQPANFDLGVALGFALDEAAVLALRDSLVFKPDRRRALFMAERMRPDFVFHTAALEGNPFTFPEVKTLIEGTTVGGHKVSDAEQVLNLNDSLSTLLQWVRQDRFAVNAQTACQLQGLVARNEALEYGVFRSSRVYIAGTDYQPPAAEQLLHLFEQGRAALEAESDPVLKALKVFLWGSLRQFFFDGNKRTSRLLASGVLLQAGLPPLMMLAQDRLRYNQIMTDFYQRQDGTEALLWLLAYYQNHIQGLGF